MKGLAIIGIAFIVIVAIGFQHLVQFLIYKNANANDGEEIAPLIAVIFLGSIGLFILSFMLAIETF